jgi:hypothetical protein
LDIVFLEERYITVLETVVEGVVCGWLFCHGEGEELAVCIAGLPPVGLLELLQLVPGLLEHLLHTLTVHDRVAILVHNSILSHIVDN